MNIGITNEYVTDCTISAGNWEAGVADIYSSIHPPIPEKIKSALTKKGVLKEIFKFRGTGLEVWSKNSES